jgi:predicted amidophosphoribosyltransferase
MAKPSYCPKCKKEIKNEYQLESVYKGNKSRYCPVCKTELTYHHNYGCLIIFAVIVIILYVISKIAN